MTIRKMMRFMAYYGYGPTIAISAIMEYLFRGDRSQLKVRIVYISFTLYTLSVLKLIYGQIRPYMMYMDIHQDLSPKSGCDMEYGNPSGHSLSFPVALMISTIDYLNYFQQSKSKVTKTSVIFFTLLQILLVGFSRVYLGVHSFN